MHRFFPALLAAVPLVALSGTVAAEQRPIQAIETAGIRRSNYPLSAVVHFDPPAPIETQFRLLPKDTHLNGKPIACQCRPMKMADDGVAIFCIEFVDDLAPHETKNYILEFGSNVQTIAPDFKHGTNVVETREDVYVTKGRREFRMSKQSPMALDSVKLDGLEFLTLGSPGFYLTRDNGVRQELKVHQHSTLGPYIQKGPIVSVVEYEGTVDLTGKAPQIPSQLEASFPASQDWVRITWSLEDSQGDVGGLGIELSLHLDRETRRVGFGAANQVEVTLPKDQEAVLFGDLSPLNIHGRTPEPLWKIVTGPPQELLPFVVGPVTGGGAPPEGWARVMDDKRCTTAGISDFAKATTDRIEVGPGDRLDLHRQFPPNVKGNKKVVFWFQFAKTPPHPRAIPSPQSMLTPPLIRAIYSHVDLRRQP